MPAGGRRRVLADRSAPVTRPAFPRPAFSGSRDPRDREHHQNHQAEGNARRDDVQSQPGQMSRLALGYHPHDRSSGDQDGADHDRHGGRHRQDDDEPHPPGRGGFRAHGSTIASRLPARKPNGRL
jgi:hypothetical protein